MHRLFKYSSVEPAQKKAEMMQVTSALYELRIDLFDMINNSQGGKRELVEGLNNHPALDSSALRAYIWTLMSIYYKRTV